MNTKGELRALFASRKDMQRHVKRCVQIENDQRQAQVFPERYTERVIEPRRLFVPRKGTAVKRREKRIAKHMKRQSKRGLS